MKSAFRTFGAFVLSVTAGALAAADFSDPTWPCQQRKVAALSAGLMWPDEAVPAALPDPLDGKASELAATLALRRVDLDQADALVADFAAGLPEDQAKAAMAQVFLRVFDAVGTERSRIMGGIATYSLKQAKLSERIAGARYEMARLEAEKKPDFDRIDALEEQLAWDQRIWKDRQQSLSYVCETPVLLEKRLYALAQILQKAR